MCTYIAHIREDGVVQTCNDHSHNVASIASKLLSQIGLSHTGYLAGLLHDMGKYSDEFLSYIKTVTAGEEYSGGKVIHTFTGVSYILVRYHDNGDFEKITSEVIALAIGSHHGLFDIYKEAENFNAFLYRMKKQPEYDKRVISSFLTECASEEEIDKLFQRSTEEIRRFYSCFANDLKNDNGLKYNKLFFYLSMLARLILSAVVEGDRRDTASFMLDKNYEPNISVNWGKELSLFNSYISSFSKETDIQKARMKFSEACFDFAKEDGGIYRLDLPTGGGKTLSGLRYALNHASIQGKNRIFYVAPLLTILEQNAQVITKAVGSENILLHYSNIAEDSSSQDELDKRELLQDSWENKIIITTLVQMLQTMFSGKMSSVRRFNALSNSVVIFDEIQSLPIKVYSMFNLAVNFLAKYCKTTVILCSATLPCFENATYKMDISNRQMISSALLEETRLIFKRTEIKEWKDAISLKDVPDVVLSQTSESESVLLVCNTKKEATNIFNELKTRTSLKLFHLSAGMCPRHRKDMLQKLTKALGRKEKLICVSTQVIEAGIDISFACVFRFAAGIDSVVQSAGRCNRNGVISVPQDVYILKVIDESLKGLREIQRSKETVFNLLSQFNETPQNFDNDLSSFKSIGYYYKLLFSGLNNEEQDYPNPRDGNKPTLFSYLSINPQIDRDGVKKDGREDYLYCQSFESAGSLFEVFDNIQKSVIVPYDDEAKSLIAQLQSESIRHNLPMQEMLIRKAKDFSVSLFNFSFDALQKSGAILQIEDLGVSCLSEEFYDDYTGVSNKEVKECDTLMM